MSPEKVINYSYPKRAVNSEAMIVTNEGLIFIFSKDDSGVSEIFAINSVTSTITQIGQVNIRGIIPDYNGRGPRITDASLSRDNQKLLLLTYGDVMEVDAELFVKGGEASKRRRGVDYNVIRGPYLPQQETITYLNQGRAFLLSSESPKGEQQDILAYKYN